MQQYSCTITIADKKFLFYIIEEGKKITSCSHIVFNYRNLLLHGFVFN